MNLALLVSAVGLCGLWWVGVGLAMIKNYRGLADWWTKQPDIWRLGPRIERPTDPSRAKATRINAFAFLVFGVLFVVMALAGAVKALIPL